LAGRSLAGAAADGCYDATRAAALSGVPKTTVYWWATHGVVVPSISPVREKLWSYSDLMALRIVSWLRHAKHAEAGELLPASPMPRVRRAMALIDEIGLELWWRAPADEHDSPLLVDGSGNIYVRDGDQVLNLDRQPTLLPDRTFGLTAPFTAAGGDGPDLRVPRPHLRIVPAKVTGEPHIEHSRVTTPTVAALATRGYSSEQIAAMYDLAPVAISESIDLERQLTGSALVA
jgi:uncharacterized protein (DUF433 family)